MKFITLRQAEMKGDIVINPAQIVAMNIATIGDAKTVIYTSNPNIIYYVQQSIDTIKILSDGQ